MDNEISNSEYPSIDIVLDHKNNLESAIAQTFRIIQPGTFMMGSPEDEVGRGADEVQHPVTITKPFLLADTPVTNRLWAFIMGDISLANQLIDGNNDAWLKTADHPKTFISYNDIESFMAVLNQIMRQRNYRIPPVRLPTEAEWEYACRAGTTTPFSFGQSITTDQVNYSGNYSYISDIWERIKGHQGNTVGVKERPCNAWGLYQMHGNVWEWCQDCYDFCYYAESPLIDPQGPAQGSRHVCRGGDWLSPAVYARSAQRYIFHADGPGSTIGFRLAADWA